jgi:hypothetical protein
MSSALRLTASTSFNPSAVVCAAPLARFHAGRAYTALSSADFDTAPKKPFATNGG